jgi:hypothetical protein
MSNPLLNRETMIMTSEESTKSTMIFTDGVEIKTSGPYRIVREADGLYVVGEGSLCAVGTQEEAEQLLRELVLRNSPSSIKDH